MIVEEIVLGKSVSSKQEAIRKNLGKEVILNDAHNSWCHGILLGEKGDNMTYHIKILSARGERRFDYSNLNQLLLLTPSQYG